VRLIIPYEAEGRRHYLTIQAFGTNDKRKYRRIIRWVAKTKLGWSLNKGLIDALIKSSEDMDRRIYARVTQQQMDEMSVRMNNEDDDPSYD
jgi:hypothetical protein